MEQQSRMLDAALAAAVFEGWTEGMLARAAVSTGGKEFDAKRAFPGGVREALDTFAKNSDARMLETLARDYNLAALKIRQRIATAVMVRLRLLLPHREAVRRAHAWYAMPWNAAHGLSVLYRTVDAMWAAAGDTATDYNFYTKRLLLANVYMSTLTVWFEDTEDLAETEAFLYRRIENVMQIEKAKASLKSALPSLFSTKKRA